MSRKIEIAKAEPAGLPQMRHAFEAAEAVAFDAPSAIDTKLTGQRVEDGVDVGRNVQSPPLNVVAGVDNDGQVLGSNRVEKSLYKLRATGAASQNDDHLGSPR